MRVPYENGGRWEISVNSSCGDVANFEIYLVSVTHDDIDTVFYVPEGGVKERFSADGIVKALADMNDELKDRINSLEYALKYGPSVINQYNAYVEIINRLIRSLPYDYRKAFNYDFHYIYSV